MAKHLISKGHEVRVLLHQGQQYGITEIYEYQGVTVFPVTKNNKVSLELPLWSTHMMTHLEYTGWTIEMSRIAHVPCFQIVHNDTPYDCVVSSYKPLNIIYNSQWIADKLKYKHTSMVMTPPVDIAKYDVGKDPRDNPYITLINCNKNKGGVIFGKIAEAMPDRQFLAVRGSYDGHFAPDLPNIKTIDNTPNILPVYEQTRILLMPSKYESWGMTASEAMCNGIPVICTKTPGLLENTAGKMLYCDRDDISGWVKAIKKLDKPKTYSDYSVAGRARARELDPAIGYQKLEEFINVAK